MKFMNVSDLILLGFFYINLCHIQLMPLPERSVYLIRVHNIPNQLVLIDKHNFLSFFVITNVFINLHHNNNVKCTILLFQVFLICIIIQEKSILQANKIKRQCNNFMHSRRGLPVYVFQSICLIKLVIPMIWHIECLLVV